MLENLLPVLGKQLKEIMRHLTGPGGCYFLLGFKEFERILDNCQVQPKSQLSWAEVAKLCCDKSRLFHSTSDGVSIFIQISNVQHGKENFIL